MSESDEVNDFHSLDDNTDELEAAAERDALRDRVQVLEAQLPEGMKDCTITFHECEKGHGWLSAKNWVQHGCPTCERDALRAQVRALEEELSEIHDAREQRDSYREALWAVQREHPGERIASIVDGALREWGALAPPAAQPEPGWRCPTCGVRFVSDVVYASHVEWCGKLGRLPSVSAAPQPAPPPSCDACPGCDQDGCPMAEAVVAPPPAPAPAREQPPGVGELMQAYGLPPKVPENSASSEPTQAWLPPARCETCATCGSRNCPPAGKATEATHSCRHWVAPQPAPAAERNSAEMEEVERLIADEVYPLCSRPEEKP